ncbi:GNAT family N-acetyltransferase [Blastococcus atacamensis]|uniref:GNAT family N-acetyltransferase n=1 Tax=Blastococcus atacamensis TaxID=2070508 RepID=UPI00130011CD|nr:GNAT family N-acetyltransferase [Blastococcus atacamensis]
MPDLLLRVPVDDDAAVWHALFDDPEVMRFIGTGEVRDRAAYVELVGRQQSLAASTGLCLFTVVADGEVAGFTGLLPWSRPWGPESELELGWRLGRRFWGRGIATVAAGMAVERARKLSVPRLVSMIQDGNDASVAVARRIGMTPHALHLSPEGRRVHEYAVSLG